MRVRRWAVVVSVLLSVLAMAAVPASAAEEPSFSPAGIGGETGFMEIRDDGGLWYYQWTGNGFRGWPTNSTGWGQTKLIATVGSGRFVELKGDLLRTWELFWNGSAFRVRLLEESCCGWATVRFVTGVGNVRGDGGNEIVGVTANGDLMLYLARGNGYVFEERLDNGYENVRLMAGVAGPGSQANGHYVLVNDRGELWEYFMRPSGTPPFGTFRDSGWQNVRLFGSGGGNTSGDTFVSVRHSGELVQWAWDTVDFRYEEVYRDTNWFNARLIG